MQTIQGSGHASGRRFAVIVSKYNDFVTDRLQTGAVAALEAAGVSPDAITIVRVPGAFEIPLAAQHAGESGRFDAVICLGCLIRGETPHFEYIASEVTRGIGRIIADHQLPVAFGVLTTDSVEQALDRAGERHGNKGYEAATTALEMARLAALLR
jgi:6,7-dimethyl-8-ribityllumazine synthase